MKKSFVSGALGVAVVLVSALGGVPAHAAEVSSDSNDPTSSQNEAIAAWEAGANRVTIGKVGYKGAKTTASGSGQVRLDRGSWLMWAEEVVDFSYNNSSVTWSSAYQRSGAVFPNNVREDGTSLIYSSSSVHKWRGKYTVGAGVPTPWGNVNVYNASSAVRSDIKAIGSMQWWE